MIETAREYLSAELSVIPTVKETKAPAPVLGKWTKYKHERAEDSDLTKWFGNGAAHCMAIICGSVSRNVECLDFDLRGELYKHFAVILNTERKELWHRLVIQRTQNYGYHLWYRSMEKIPGNMKLAERGIEVSGPGEHEYQGKKYAARKQGDKWFLILTLIETRGEGGYALCHPSPGYELLRGNFANLPVLTQEEREYLIGVARGLNEWMPLKKAALPKITQPQQQSTNLTPWDDYNAKTNPLTLLLAEGWTETSQQGTTPQGGSTVLIRRPGKSHGHSGSIVDGQLFHCWTSNAPPFDPDKAYNSYQVYAHLHHNGDFSAAASRLLKDGFGERPAASDRKAALIEDPPETTCIERLNTNHAVIMVGGKCLVLNEVTDPIFGRPDITLSTVADFKNWYASDRVMVENERGESRSVSVSKLWLESRQRRQYKGIVFKPGEDVEGHYNLYRGLAVKPRQGDWSRLREHIQENVCGGNEEHYRFMMSWFAHLIQCPGGDKPGTSVVMRGARGVGKGCLMAAIGPILGSHYIHITNETQLAGRFNAHMKDALLCFADECFWAGDKASESILKGMITNDYVMVEAKGKDPFPVMSHLRVVMASNDEWVVPAGLEERRFFVLDVGSRRMQDTAYFGTIFAEMANGGREALLHDLLQWDWAQVDLRTAPRTAGLFDQIEATMGSVEKWWFEALRRGSQTRGASDWEGHVITDVLYTEYVTFCEQIGTRHKATPVAFSKKLRDLCTVLVRKQVPGRSYGAREWALYFDTLEDCRSSFERKVRLTIEWES